MPLLLHEHEVDELLTMPKTIWCVEEAFRMLGAGEAVNCPRRRGTVDGAVLNVMWALAPTIDAMGVKIYPMVRSGITQGTNFTFLLYDLAGGDLKAVVEAGVIGQRRTGAASAVATRYLARQESETLVIFGTGWQAESQVEAVASVLPELSRVLVVGRSLERREGFLEKMRRILDVEIEASEPESAVRRADVIITATGSGEPLFDGAWIRPGTHINAIGSNLAEKSELDRATLLRSDRVVADSCEVARLESGDLLRNSFNLGQLTELGALVAAAEFRDQSDEEQITLFESHGLALQDLVCANTVLEEARRRRVGAELPL